MNRRFYKKIEIARLYYPGITPQQARRRMRQNIMRLPGLLAELRLVGYDERSRYFSIAQLDILMRHFGKP